MPTSSQIECQFASLKRTLHDLQRQLLAYNRNQRIQQQQIQNKRTFKHKGTQITTPYSVEEAKKQYAFDESMYSRNKSAGDRSSRADQHDLASLQYYALQSRQLQNQHKSPVNSNSSSDERTRRVTCEQTDGTARSHCGKSSRICNLFKCPNGVMQKFTYETKNLRSRSKQRIEKRLQIVASRCSKGSRKKDDLIKIIDTEEDLHNEAKLSVDSSNVKKEVSEGFPCQPSEPQVKEQCDQRQTNNKKKLRYDSTDRSTFQEIDNDRTPDFLKECQQQFEATPCGHFRSQDCVDTIKESDDNSQILGTYNATKLIQQSSGEIGLFSDIGSLLKSVIGQIDTIQIQSLKYAQQSNIIISQQEQIKKLEQSLIEKGHQMAIELEARKESTDNNLKTESGSANLLPQLSVDQINQCTQGWVDKYQRLDAELNEPKHQPNPEATKCKSQVPQSHSKSAESQVDEKYSEAAAAQQENNVNVAHQQRLHKQQVIVNINAGRSRNLFGDKKKKPASRTLLGSSQTPLSSASEAVHGSISRALIHNSPSRAPDRSPSAASQASGSTKKIRGKNFDPRNARKVMQPLNLQAIVNAPKTIKNESISQNFAVLGRENKPFNNNVSRGKVKLNMAMVLNGRSHTSRNLGQPMIASRTSSPVHKSGHQPTGAFATCNQIDNHSTSKPRSKSPIPRSAGRSSQTRRPDRAGKDNRSPSCQSSVANRPYKIHNMTQKLINQRPTSRQGGILINNKENYYQDDTDEASKQMPAGAVVLNDESINPKQYARSIAKPFASINLPQNSRIEPFSAQSRANSPEVDPTKQSILEIEAAPAENKFSQNKHIRQPMPLSIHERCKQALPNSQIKDYIEPQNPILKPKTNPLTSAQTLFATFKDKVGNSQANPRHFDQFHTFGGPQSIRQGLASQQEDTDLSPKQHTTEISIKDKMDCYQSVQMKNNQAISSQK